MLTEHVTFNVFVFEGTRINAFETSTFGSLERIISCLLRLNFLPEKSELVFAQPVFQGLGRALSLA